MYTSKTNIELYSCERTCTAVDAFYFQSCYVSLAAAAAKRIRAVVTPNEHARSLMA